MRMYLLPTTCARQLWYGSLCNGLTVPCKQKTTDVTQYRRVSKLGMMTTRVFPWCWATLSFLPEARAKRECRSSRLCMAEHAVNAISGADDKA